MGRRESNPARAAVDPRCARVTTRDRIGLEASQIPIWLAKFLRSKDQVVIFVTRQGVSAKNTPSARYDS